MRKLAGPRGRLISGHLPDFRRDRLAFFTHCARTYGDVVPLRIVHRKCLLISDPELIEQVVVSKSKNFIKHFGLRIYKPILGNGLVTSEGELWRRQRKLSAPAFQAARLPAYAQLMVAATLESLATWPADGVRDVHADMSTLTLEIACKTLFGAAAPPDARAVGGALLDAMEALGRRIRRTVPLPEWLPTPANRRLWKSIATLDAIVLAIIEQGRRAGQAESADLLSILLRATDDDGASMSDLQLLDEVRTLFIAGHETTALALTYSLYLLARHPEEQASMHEDLANVLEGRPASYSDLPRLRRTRNVVAEALRLYPPADVIGRETLADCEIGDVTVRKGTNIFMSQWVMHHDPRFFDQPEEFKPDRWTDEFERALPRFAYFPFGGGPRFCIGQNFALAEAALTLATICQRFRFSAVDAAPLELWPAITLRPRNGVPLRAEARAPRRD
jgi:cytochrome P450